MATSAQVQQLYIALLGRAADKPGLDWWLENINGGERTLEQAAAAFTTSEEYVATYGSLQGAELVTAVYSNLFERTPSAEEVAYWVEDGRPADELLAAFLTYASPADRAVINNKVFVAEAYSNATGEDYNLEAAAQIIADVNGTAASVTAALGQLESGTLPGNVPGLALINNASDAAAQVVTAQKAAFAEYKDDLSATTSVGVTATNFKADVLDNLPSPTKSLNVLNAELADANAELAAAKTAAVAVAGGANAVNDYEVALAAQAALTANDPAKVAATAAGFAEVLGATGATVTLATLSDLAPTATSGGDFADYDDLYAFLVDTASNAVERANVLNAIKDLPYGADVTALANNDLAINKADDAVSAAKSTVEGLSGGVGLTYTTEVGQQAVAQKALDDAQKLLDDIAAAKSFHDQLVAAEKSVADAAQAITDFETANGQFDLTDLTADVAATADSDVFYFSALKADSDFAISNFGAAGNDYLVIGSGFTAGTTLEAGDNNVLEYFLVQGTSGVELYLETNKFGSETYNAAAPTADGVAVINLVGLTVDQLQVADGVVSLV